MIRFSVNGKELKNMIDKVLTVVPKKSSVPELGSVYFKVENGNMSVFSTDLDQWLEASTNWAMDTEDGILGVDIDDIKILTNSKSEVQCVGFEDCGELKMRVKTGNKTVNIAAKEYEIDNPEVEELKPFMESTESWLYDTFTKLVTFLSPNNPNKMMGAYNINLKDRRVETLDGHRIGTRFIPADMIKDDTDRAFTVNYTANNVFKKLLDKKSDNDVHLYGGKKYVLFKGNDFRYLMRRIDGQYWNINNMLRKYESTDIAFTVDRSELMEVTKYDADLAKDERKPLIIYCRDGQLYTYMWTSRYEVLDMINANTKGDYNFIMAINPKFVTDALQVVDSDTPFIYGTNSKSPWIVVGEDYNVLILPVTFDSVSYEANIQKCIAESYKKEA